MGTKGYINLKEAATILRCTQKKVIELAKKGSMRSMRSPNGRLVHGDDVKELSRLNVADETPLYEIAHELRLTQAKVKRLENSINMLFQVNNMQSTGLSGAGIAQLVSIFNTVEKEVSNKKWTIDVILSLCEIFIKLSEEDIDRINKKLKITSSWKPFYDLVVKVSKFVDSHPRLNSSSNLQNAKKLLMLGRSNVRSVAMFHVIGQDNTEMLELLKESAASDLDMFDTIAINLKKNKNPNRLSS